MTRIDRNLPNENAAADGPRNGADCDFGSLRKERIAKRRPNAMSPYADKAHKSIARMVGFALTLGTNDAWADLSFVLRVRLTAWERKALAWCVVNALETQEVEIVLDALREGRGE